MNTPNKSLKRDAALDLMRVIAIFFVIFTHTYSDGFELYAQYNTTDFRYYLFMAVMVFAKFAVPLFFMISGALLLDREPEDIKTVLIKRVLKFVIVLVIFSILYYLYNLYYNPTKELSFSNFLTETYSSRTSTHLWFIYMYIGFLLGLPILQSVVKHVDNKYFLYLLILCIIIDGIALVQFFINGGNIKINSLLFPGWISSKVFIYPFLGYYFWHRVKPTKKMAGILWLGTLLSIVSICYCNYHAIKNGGKVLTDSIDLFTIITTTTIFVSVTLLRNRLTKDTVARRIIISIGKCTFGIYLVHMFIMRTPLRRTVIDGLCQIGIPKIFSTSIWCVITLALSYIAILILRRIPIVKKIF